MVERSQLIGGEVVLVTELGTVGLNQITGVGAPAGTVQPATDGEPATTTPTTTSSTDAPDDDPEASPSTEQSTTVPTETSSTPNDSESEIPA